MRDLAWPVEQVGEVLVALARTAGLPTNGTAPVAPIGAALDDRWLSAAASVIGIGLERHAVALSETAMLATSSRPMIVPLGGTAAATHLLALAGPRRILTPDRRVARISLDQWRALVCGPLEDAPSRDADRVLGTLGLSGARLDRARRQMVAAHSSDVEISAWTIDPPADAPIGLLARHYRFGRQIAQLVAAHGTYLVLWVLAWWVIGAGALGGHVDRGWMIAWMLLLAAMVPVRVAALWSEARVAVGAGALLKQRLLVGALRLDERRVSGEGAGAMLGRAIEGDAVESLALTGGFSAVVAALEIAAAAVVLGAGYSSWALVPLMAWCVLVGALVYRYWVHGRRWAAVRNAMTHALVERMVGHRTRLAQQSPSGWHEEEDQALAGYLDASRARDRAEAWLLSVVPQGWLVVGLLSVGPAFLASAIEPAALAAGLGGILLATRAFHRLAAAFWQIVDARIAWLQVAPLMDAVHSTPATGSPSGIAAAHSPAGDGAVLTIRGIVYRYPDRETAVLRQASLDLRAGDRAVLEGPSGGGKSTLAAVIGGLRTPQSGLLLAGGLDRATLGADGWRRRVAVSPQFHQNHMITGPLSFNLLMGRGGHLTEDDRREAWDVCQELGLGDVLARMPGGLQQMVGETGWQLSQGERSRVFIARTLLQRPAVVVLDESLAALDRETMDQVLSCLVKRAPSLLVIAHQ